MKKIFLLYLVGLSLLVSADAFQRDKTIDIYGVGAKTDKSKNSSVGSGLAIDSEEFKAKLESTSDFVKTALMYKFNPKTDYYIKIGANYINQKIYAPDNKNARINQYSGVLSFGYMFMDDLYLEVGGSYKRLQGSKIGSDYEIKDEIISLAYFEVAKRWFDILDTTANAGEVNYEFRDNEFSYGLGIYYYPTKNSKLEFKYQNEKENIQSNYFVQYGYVFVEYVDNISTKTYQANIGVKIAFKDITDFSTYGIPTNIKPHLSELYRFENIVFSPYMEIQSSAEEIAIDNSSANQLDSDMGDDSGEFIIPPPDGGGPSPMPPPDLNN